MTKQWACHQWVSSGLVDDEEAFAAMARSMPPAVEGYELANVTRERLDVGCIDGVPVFVTDEERAMFDRGYVMYRISATYEVKV